MEYVKRGEKNDPEFRQELSLNQLARRKQQNS